MRKETLSPKVSGVLWYNERAMSRIEEAAHLDSQHVTPCMTDNQDSFT